MPGKWHEMKLGDICDYQNGFAFKNSDYVEKSANTYEVFRMGYIERGGGYKQDSTPVFVNRNYGKNIDRFVLQKGDLTIAMTDMKNSMALLGHTAIVPESDRFVLNQRVGRIKVNDLSSLDQRFLYYYSNSRDHINYFRSRANSGVQVNLTTASITEAVLKLPPLEDQRAIAHILGTLDDKIELNRRMNETLEAIARALFKSWFVDFDPVRSKAEGRDTGLPKPLTDLFPESFEDSDLGEIPKGWEVVNLSDVADINYGQNLPQTKLLGYGIPVFGAAGFIGYYAEAMFESPIVLVTSRGSGSGTVHETNGPSFVTNNSFSVIPKDAWFSRHYLKASLLNGDISSLVTGSAQPQLTITNFSHLKLVQPDERVIREFHSFTDSVWQKMNANQGESHTLATLRDTLLPKLISGELRVPDTGRTVGRTAV